MEKIDPTYILNLDEKKLEQHLDKGMNKLKTILEDMDIKPVKLIGRVKSKDSIRAKLKNVPRGSMHGPQGQFACMDTIGIRLIIKNKEDLEKVFNYVSQTEKIIGIKDYVNKPRKDGLILGKDPKDIYQSYHIFTPSLSGIPTEIQLRTSFMERNRNGLKRKYGEGYWKSKKFRKRKYKLGDTR